MQFTLWTSLTECEGGHAEIAWESFLAFVADPAVAEDKRALEGWSPAKFRGDVRAKANTELISCIVLDDDGTGASTDQIAVLWGAHAGAVHTTHSHTDASPKHRIVLRCSRDMTLEEHERVWGVFAKGRGLDESTKDASRFWYVPGHREGAPYAWAELPGAPIDVDAVLANVPMTKGPTILPPAQPLTAPAARPLAAAAAAAAAALRISWPPKGRHEAQLALAGALRSEGWSPADAVDLLEAVAGDRPKREATVRHTWALPEDAPRTGWTRLKAFVDPVVVEGARGLLRRGVAGAELAERRLAEAAERYRKTDTPTLSPSDVVQAGPFTFRIGGLDADLPPFSWVVDEVFLRADVVMLVAHGNSLKTWLAFSLALSVASGRPWLGKFAVTMGRSAILDFESGDFEVTRRLKILGGKDGEVEDRLLRSSYSTAQLEDPETWISLVPLKLTLLVIDSFSAAAPGTDENDKRGALMLQHAGRFAEVTGCAVIFIHHARKDQSGDQRVIVRGTTAIFAACDRIFAFDEPEKKDNGIVVSTMRSIKDGAGRSPSPIKVQLSDQGLKRLEFEDDDKRQASEKKSVEDRNREVVLSTLSARPAGILQKDLINLMEGRRERKFELLSSLKLADAIAESTDRATGRAETFFVLKSGYEKTQ